MLFDLRSKRRRGLVRVVYIFLALIMIAGLVLVGVGAGNNNGGLLNAFTNNGSGSNQSSADSAQTKKAVKETKANPKSAKAWTALLEARWEQASTGSNYNSTSDTFTKDGKVQLQYAAAAWKKYLAVNTGKPSLETSTLAADVYQGLKQWEDAATAWQYVIGTYPSGSPDAIRGYVCYSLTSYAAGQKSTGALAEAKALQISPKSEKVDLKTTFNEAKGSASDAVSAATSEC